RWIHVFEHVDVDDRIRVAVDLARDDRHCAAARANVKRRGLRTESVRRHERAIADRHGEPSPRVRRPDAAVLDAEAAPAGAGRNLRRIAGPVERKRYIAAMALPVDRRRQGHLLLERAQYDL